MRKKVGIWIRVSTEDQANGDSPEHHEYRGRAYAEMKGWDVVEVYNLSGISGKTVISNSETIRMLRDIKEKRISGLIFSKLARLARNTRELLDFSEHFQQHNADLISLQENIDTSTPAGRLFFTFNAAVTQWEREEIAERVAASVPVRAKLGKPLGGAAPYGYKWVKKKLEIDEIEAPIRKRMFELFLEIKRKKSVADKLNEEGYRTRKGAKFSFTTVKRLLTDPIAKGLRRANYTKSQGLHKKWELKPKEDWVFHDVPAIVSEGLWEEVNNIIDEQEKTNKKAQKPVAHLFTGLAICTCGGKMYVPSNMQKYVCQKCRNKIGEKDLEEIFHSQLDSFLVSDEQVKSHVQTADKIVAEKQVLFEGLVAKSKELNKKLESLLELYQSGEIPKEGFSKHYNPLFEQAKQIDEQLPKLQGEIDYYTSQVSSTEEIISEARSLSNHWFNLDFSAKRNIIELITKSIVIGDSKIVINIGYLPMMPSASESMTNGHHNPRDSSRRPA